VHFLLVLFCPAWKQQVLVQDILGCPVPLALGSTPTAQAIRIAVVRKATTTAQALPLVATAMDALQILPSTSSVPQVARLGHASLHILSVEIMVGATVAHARVALAKAQIRANFRAVEIPVQVAATWSRTHVQVLRRARVTADSMVRRWQQLLRLQSALKTHQRQRMGLLLLM